MEGVTRGAAGEGNNHPVGRNNFSHWGGRSFLSSLRRLFGQNRPQKLPRTSAQATSEPTTCAVFKAPTPVCMGSQAR